MKPVKENQGIKGTIRLVLKGPDGKVKDERISENLITDLMDAHVADQMSDQGEAAIGFMAIGAGSGQTAGDTGLDASVARVALTSTVQQSGADDNDARYVGVFNPGVGTAAITEAGIMRLDDNLTLMCYDDSFGTIVKGPGDTLTITWDVTYGAS